MPIELIETGSPELQASREDGILTLTLNRPEARNAMTAAMIVALSQALAAAEIDTEVRCVILTGAGAGFCAGGDVKGMAEHGDGSGASNTVDAIIHRQRLAQHATAGRLFKMPKPTIAAINGAAAGAGLALAMACDIRLMSSAAVLTTAFAKIGLSGDFGGAYFLTRLVGTAKARELLFLSDRIDAAEAVGIGLVNRAVAPEDLATETARWAVRLAAGPSVAFRYMKENLNRALGGEIDDCLDVEVTHHIHCFATSDHREAARAFVERRDPVFVGA
ncbi:enoyl-CoA hydratase-related protein [Sphingomonas bacterium]|uniref:enoyl-CoA hydratase-related protein n=1 Tax=Sphingomonas bacterium TaxID=1895847 RepID=UPI001575CB41|nr:enoyl-CoA hydratase-related protein [Sphingomonas bacterium]